MEERLIDPDVVEDHSLLEKGKHTRIQGERWDLKDVLLRFTRILHGEPLKIEPSGEEAERTLLHCHVAPHNE